MKKIEKINQQNNKKCEQNKTQIEQNSKKWNKINDEM